MRVTRSQHADARFGNPWKDIAMRILFTTVQLSGHFHPLVPIARAAVAAGHEVTFACAPSFVPTVERVGFRAFPAGFDNRGRAIHDLFPGYFKMMAPGRYWALPNVFVGVYAVTMVPDLLTIAREWHPDLIVRDTIEYGGCVAAEVLGIPHASVRTSSPSSQYGLRHHVAEGAFGRLQFEIQGIPTEENPRTGRLVAMSVMRTLLLRRAPIVVG